MAQRNSENVNFQTDYLPPFQDRRVEWEQRTINQEGGGSNTTTTTSATTATSTAALSCILLQRFISLLVKTARCLMGHHYYNQRLLFGERVAMPDQTRSLLKVFLITLLGVAITYYAWMFLKDFACILCVTFVILALLSPA